jgi:hypothetical protein
METHFAPKFTYSYARHTAYKLHLTLDLSKQIQPSCIVVITLITFVVIFTSTYFLACLALSEVTWIWTFYTKIITFAGNVIKTDIEVVNW